MGAEAAAEVHCRGEAGADPGTSSPRRDVHQSGPEEVYVLTGTFNDGARDYPAGTFLHAPAGSWHVPATTTSCTLFVFYPAA